MIAFWVKVKTKFFTKNYSDSFMGNFWKNLSYYLFRHVVTLPCRLSATKVFVKAEVPRPTSFYVT